VYKRQHGRKYRRILLLCDEGGWDFLKEVCLRSGLGVEVVETSSGLKYSKPRDKRGRRNKG